MPTETTTGAVEGSSAAPPLGGEAAVPPPPASRTVIVRFPEPDAAYLVLAALRRRLQGAWVATVYLVPTAAGPALEVPAEALDDPALHELVELFEGRIPRRRGSPPPA